MLPTLVDPTQLEDYRRCVSNDLMYYAKCHSLRNKEPVLKFKKHVLKTKFDDSFVPQCQFLKNNTWYLWWEKDGKITGSMECEPKDEEMIKAVTATLSYLDPLVNGTYF